LQIGLKSGLNSELNLSSSSSKLFTILNGLWVLENHRFK